MKDSKFSASTFLFLAATIFFLCFSLYWPKAQMGFILDDHYVVAQNPIIKNPRLYCQAFSTGLFDAAHRASDLKLQYYRPLITLSFIADYTIWGMRAQGYRITNIVLHGLNSVLVFLGIFFLFEDIPLAVLTALIFCALPVHEWVVRYIVGRGDLLQAFFSLSSMITITLSVKKRSRTWYAWGIAATFAALLCREVAVLNVLYIALIGGYLTRDYKKAVAIALPFFVLSLTYIVSRAAFLPIFSADPSVSVFLKYSAELPAMISIAAHLLIPASLLKVCPASPVAAVLVMALWGSLVFVCLKRNKSEHNIAVVVFASCWLGTVVFSLLATVNIIERLGPVLSDHFLYFPSIGFALLWAFILGQKRHPIFTKLYFISLMGFFMIAGLSQGAFWMNEETLLRHVQRVEGQKFTVAYEQLAMRYDHDESRVREILATVKTPSGQSLWVRKLGDLKRQELKYTEAIQLFMRAIKLNPFNVEAINELAVSYFESGDEEKGKSTLESSLKADPQGAEAYRLLGIYHYRKGDFLYAIKSLKYSLYYDPGNEESLLYSTMAYYFMNDQAEYLRSLDNIAPRFADDRAILIFVARELFAHARYSDAVRVLGPTRVLYQNDPEIISILAESLRHLKK